MLTVRAGPASDVLFIVNDGGVAPGAKFYPFLVTINNAETYNGEIPGPTLRLDEGRGVARITLRASRKHLVSINPWEENKHGSQTAKD